MGSPLGGVAGSNPARGVRKRQTRPSCNGLHFEERQRGPVTVAALLPAPLAQADAARRPTGPPTADEHAPLEGEADDLARLSADIALARQDLALMAAPADPAPDGAEGSLVASGAQASSVGRALRVADRSTPHTKFPQPDSSWT